jgi:hypothetical protein
MTKSKIAPSKVDIYDIPSGVEFVSDIKSPEPSVLVKPTTKLDKFLVYKVQGNTEKSTQPIQNIPETPQEEEASIFSIDGMKGLFDKTKALVSKANYMISITSGRGISLLSTLRTERVNDGTADRILLEDMVYAISTPHYTGVIVVPKGFRTNFASLPKIVSGFVDWRSLDINAVLHDYLYSYDSNEYKVFRKVADEIFMMGAYTFSPGVHRYKAKILYWGLRVGGQKAFIDGKKKNK